MKQLHAIKEIDEVLKIFLQMDEVEINRNSLENKLLKRGIQIHYKRLNRILNKLVRDKYLDSKPYPVNWIQLKPIREYYWPTFEAEMFAQEGYYEGYFRQENRDETKRKCYDTMLAYGAVFAAIGTFLLFGVELWKLWPHHHCH